VIDIEVYVRTKDKGSTFWIRPNTFKATPEQFDEAIRTFLPDGGKNFTFIGTPRPNSTFGLYDIVNLKRTV
jgi:hypothetical protein